jgi:hypothetical protein
MQSRGREQGAIAGCINLSTSFGYENFLLHGHGSTAGAGLACHSKTAKGTL